MLDSTYAALSDPTRRAILARLARGEATVGEIAAPFAMSQPAVSRHLKVLEAAGLIETRIDGARRPRRLNPAALRDAHAWLSDFAALWEDRFARLDAVLADLQTGKGPDDAP